MTEVHNQEGDEGRDAKPTNENRQQRADADRLRAQNSRRLMELMATGAWRMRTIFYNMLEQIDEEIPEMILVKAPEKQVTLSIKTGSIGNVNRTYGNPYATYFLPRMNEMYSVHHGSSGRLGIRLEPKYDPEKPEFIGIEALKKESDAKGGLPGANFIPMHREPVLDTNGNDVLSSVSTLGDQQIGIILDFLERELIKPNNKQLVRETKSQIFSAT